MAEVLSGQAGRAPWLRSRLTTDALDVQVVSVYVALLVAAGVVVGKEAWLLAGLCVLASLTAGLLAGSLLRGSGWVTVCPRVMYLVSIGLGASLLLRPSDGPLRAGVVGLVAGVVSLWVGRSSPVCVHPALLAVLVAWPLASSWPSLWLDDAEVGSSVVRVVERGVEEPVLRANPEAPTASLLLSCFDAVVLDPNHYQRVVLDGQIPSVYRSLWDGSPSWLGAVSVPVVLLCCGWLMWGRLIPWRVAVYGVVGGVLVLLLWPVGGSGWFAFGSLLPSGIRGALAWVIHVVLGTPMPLLLLVYAGQNGPINLGGRVLYGFAAGGLCVSGMLLTGEPEGAVAGLVAAGLGVRWLDRMRTSPFVG